MDKTSLKYLVRKGCFFTASIYNRQLNFSFQANNIHLLFQLKQRKQNQTYFLNIWLKLIVYLTVILFSGSTVIMPLIISWTSVGMKTGILKCPLFTWKREIIWLKPWLTSFINNKITLSTKKPQWQKVWQQRWQMCVTPNTAVRTVQCCTFFMRWM